MKKEGGSTSETEADRQSSDECDIHDFSTYSYIEDSDDADIENVEGFSEENVLLMEDICLTELFGINN